MSTLTKKKDELKPSWPSVGEYGFVPIDSIVPSPYNPRKHFDEEETDAIAISITIGGQRDIGTVRELTEEEIQTKYPHARYMLTSGERRWRGAKKAGKELYEVRVKAYVNSAEEKLDAFMLNEDRIPISDLENAWYVEELSKEFGWTSQAEIARNINKDQVWVSQTLSLLKLCPEVQARMHPSIKPDDRMRKQVGVFLSRMQHDVQRDLCNRMPPELKTATAQLAWLRKEADVRGVSLETRERKPVTLRDMIGTFALAMQNKADELLSASELSRLFENTDTIRAKALAASLRRAYVDFGQLVERVEELASGEKRQTMIVPYAQKFAAKAQPTCTFLDYRKRRLLTSVLWFNAISDRYIPDEVTNEQYAALYDRKLLKFQKEGAPKPFHYPDREKITITD